MKTIICLFLILTISVATDVKVYVYNGYGIYGSHTKPAPRDIFRFGYQFGDAFSMQIYLNIKDPNVSAGLYVQYPPDVGKKELPKISDKVSQYFEIRRILNVGEIVIYLELNTTTGPRTRKQIVKGINVAGFPHSANDTLYSDICTTLAWCVIEVDLLNNLNTVSDTETPVKKVAQKSYALVITLSLAGVAVILLVVVATWKRCWIKRGLQGTPRLQTNQTTADPFYVNMLFRRECEREIAEIDQHVYEEVGPPIYEVINPQLTERNEYR